jgi:hypothetical protein
MARLNLALCLMAAMGVAGCSTNHAVLDPASLSSFLDLRTINDTASTVNVQGCWDAHCRDTSNMLSNDVGPGASSEQAFWNSVESGGIAVVRISRGNVVTGCLVVRYAKGQEHATARVSDAHSC